MSIEEKEATIIGLNLFSGSADEFRTAMGGYFEIVDVETTEDTTVTTGQEIQQKEFIATEPESPFISGITEEEAYANSAEVIIPNYRYPVRATADSDNYKGDDFWKIYWAGGSYEGIIYSAIYNKTVWNDYWFELGLPYSKIEANSLVEKESVISIAQISCTYNYYLPEYQTHVDTLKSELLIPNMYAIEMFNAQDIADGSNPQGLMSETESVDSRLYNKTIEDFVSLQGLYDISNAEDADSEEGGIDDLLKDKETIYLAAPPAAATDTSVATSEGLPNYTLHGYLSQSVPLTTLSSSTTEYVKNAFQNIFFDQYSVNGGTTNPTFLDMENNASLFPYYVNISFPARNQATSNAALDEFGKDFNEAALTIQELADVGVAATMAQVYGFPTYFVESTINNNYSPKLLKVLKEVFSNEVASVAPSAQDYALSKDYQSSSAESTIDDQVLTTDTVSFRSVDYLKLLNYSRNNYKSTTDNCYFMGEKLINREAAMDPTGTYRYLNSKNGDGIVDDIIEFLNDESYAPSSSTVEELLTGWRTNGKYNETIAYRVEKMGNSPTGDARTQNILQNFWIFNSIHLPDDINLFDSQVKYGQNYTYNIYAYVAVAGIKYQLSDLRLTRQINYNEESTYPYCLEFYNPETDAAANQLVTPDEVDLSPTLDNSEFPAMADAYVNYESNIRLFEIPIASKTLKVLDNPANQLLINPFQLLDASQTIGYTVEYERFVEQPYPKTISSANITSKQDYLNAKDLLEGENLTEAPVSRQRYLEIYRLNEKPKTFSDFDNNLVSTIDLKEEDSKFTLPSAIFYDMIKTNQKYYYLFRALNENRMPGALSEIYEAQLINDGGYTYSNFDILFEEDLEEEIFVDPTLTFKKLIQLQPNMSQIVFNDGAVDYTNTAASQMGAMALGDADDLIWGKTFKIRLTSKKTGKKMDLNVTYKYETESN